MEKKSLLGLMTISTIALSTCVGLVALTSSTDTSIPTRADQTYSLTIDTSNSSNFVKIEDYFYRGTFKTALGNDITFETNQTPYSSNCVFYVSGSNVTLKNTTPLTGLYKIEVSACVFYKSQFNVNPTLRPEMRVSLDQTESFYYDDYTFSGETLSTKTFEIPTEKQYGNYVNLTLSNEDVTAQLRIASLKFYFKCSDAKSYLKVASSNESYGTVSIDGYDSKEAVINSGTQVTVHANPIINHQTEYYSSFKGWHLNGSEEIISTDLDYTFTLTPTNSYNLVATFTEAETESFNQGVDTSGDKLTTYVKNKNNKYYPLNSVKDDNTSFPTALTDKVNELFIAQHLSRENYLTHLELNIDRKGHGNWEPFDPDKVQAVIFYMNMDQPTQYDPVGIDQFVTTNGTLTTYSGLKDKTDGNKAMSKVVWTNFTSNKAEFYVPNEYRNPDNIIKHNIWIKRMKVVYR